MEIKGNLLGCNVFDSKKGTTCLFGSLEAEYDPVKEPAGLGYKAIQFAAFGIEAKTLYSKIKEESLLNRNVSLSGLYNGNTFQAISINQA